MSLKARPFDLSDFDAADSEDAPIARLLQSIFEDAIQVRASDIHLEPDAHGTTYSPAG